MTFVETGNTLVDFIVGLDAVLGHNVLPLLFLAGVYLVLMASFRSYDTVQISMISGFITTILAGLFFFVGLAAWWVVTLFAIMFLASIVINFFVK